MAAVSLVVTPTRLPAAILAAVSLVVTHGCAPAPRPRPTVAEPSFVVALQREAAALFADRQSAPGSITLFDGRRWLLEPGTLRALGDAARAAESDQRRRELTHLRGFLLIESLREAAAPADARLFQIERQPVTVPGLVPVPYRLLAARLAVEPSIEQRRNLAHAAAPIVAKLSPLLALRRDGVRARARALGFASAIDLLAAAQGRDLRSVGALAEDLLTRSEALYRGALREITAAHLGAATTELGPGDLARLGGWLAPGPGTVRPSPLCRLPAEPFAFLAGDRSARDAWEALRERVGRNRGGQGSLRERLGRDRGGQPSRLAHTSNEQPPLTAALGELLVLRRAAVGVLLVLAWHRGVAQSPTRL